VRRRPARARIAATKRRIVAGQRADAQQEIESGLNLKSGAGKEVYVRLAQRADVVVEEYRPGVAKRLGQSITTRSAGAIRN